MATLTDPIADFLIRLKNASRAGNDSFKAPHSKMKVEIARILKEEGYIWNYDVDTSAKFPELIVKTKFVDGVPALTDLKRISKCGRRKYSGSQEIPRVLNGMGISIISTSKGLMTGHRAKKDKVGGEIIAFVW
ncbi:MAG: 30S ribosomal protein S8 [Akkermansiaceae bacterium]|jgi:small subunit ribosomal protein S8|nr:30S ribosomal protein S8 [Verrucomicrobiales bacterium]MBR9809524.1 30S ribosomal protein S8 [bacterium]MCH1497807.1 30S ribosomal protein S8 [Akkermansiaceae bacterium]MDC0187761.1 30S ribosomal protein S8 [Verrucomicrobiota bacterium]RZN89954.1 MAG: 30S ribosomal protein S8 [Verrucomicrobiaceae bacterium]|tara:strand:- start:108 stop:506 length:399 start_codon:yes stop_codon:yes gene_type:complete